MLRLPDLPPKAKNQFQERPTDCRFKILEQNSTAKEDTSCLASFQRKRKAGKTCRTFPKQGTRRGTKTGEEKTTKRCSSQRVKNDKGINSREHHEQNVGK